MSQVHKSERGESRFEVMENALKLKRQLRELDYIRNYGHIALLRKRKILRHNLMHKQRSYNANSALKTQNQALKCRVLQ